MNMSNEASYSQNAPRLMLLLENTICSESNKYIQQNKISIPNSPLVSFALKAGRHLLIQDINLFQQRSISDFITPQSAI